MSEKKKKRPAREVVREETGGSNRREVVKGGGVVAALAVFGRVRFGGKSDHVGIATANGASFIRPPGAVDEAEFARRCIRCHKCGENCSAGCIKFIGPEGPPELRGTPYIVPREKACVLCMRCNNGCPSGALQPIPEDHPRLWEVVDMGTAQFDENICNSYNGYICGVCIRACPLGGLALKAGAWEKPIHNTDYCVGCGLCEQSCVHMPQAVRVKPARRDGNGDPEGVA